MGKCQCFKALYIEEAGDSSIQASPTRKFFMFPHDTNWIVKTTLASTGAQAERQPAMPGRILIFLVTLRWGAFTFPHLMQKLKSSQADLSQVIEPIWQTGN